MSVAALSFSAAAAPEKARLSLGSPALVLLFVFPLALAMGWPKLLIVWQTGTFFDTDDALRAVQVRDWLAGQGWFDLAAHRIDPPAGLPMHWSRVVDVPLAMLIRAAELFVDPVRAERLARLVFPLALQAGMIAASAWTAQILAGPRAALPAAVLLLFDGLAYGQFQPGRIDHHAPQILLLMLMAGTTLASLDPARARLAALTGCLAALSLAIGLEAVPFLAVILSVLPIAWVRAGTPHRRALVFLSLGLAVAVPALFVATVPPGRDACTALSSAHLAAIGAGVTGLLLLAVLTPGLATVARRSAALGLTGAAVLAAIWVLAPGCLRDPYAGMDPTLTRLWLRHVTEAQPLFTATALRPDTFSMLICPVLAGAFATFAALWLTHGIARARWLAVTALVIVGCLGTLWEVRVASTLQAFALLGGAWAVARALARVEGRARAWAIVPLTLLLPFSSIGWLLMPTSPMSARASDELVGGLACRDARNLAPLADVAPGLVFAPIDLGPHLLAFTRLSVLGAPYHLNGKANRAVLDGFLASPNAAEAAVRATGARYIALCVGGTQAQVMAREAPDGLAAALAEGHVPDWLVSVPLAPTNYRLFTLR